MFIPEREQGKQGFIPRGLPRKGVASSDSGSRALPWGMRYLSFPVYMYTESMSKFRIMFICTGNICRSPLAHAVLEHMVKEEGLEDKIEIESSGTGAWHVGEQPDSRMRRTAFAHGVTLNHLSRQLIRKNLMNYNLLLAMDHHNLRDTHALCRSDEEREKVKMFRDFDPEKGGDVPDPWYGGLDGFEDVWEIVSRTCASLLKTLAKNLDSQAELEEYSGFAKRTCEQ